MSSQPAPPLHRVLRPALDVGSVLAGRYRITAPLAPADDDPPDASRWEAVDDVLARPVQVVILRAGGRRAGGARALLDAAAAASTVVSPVLAQVYDAALEQVPAERYGRAAGTVEVAYVVGEHVPGPTLAEVLTDGPFEPADAVTRALAAADALAAAHARGVVHGLVHPGTVVLTEDGGVKLADPAVGAALARLAGRNGSVSRTPQGDVRGLAGCLYAMLTGRWPEQAVPGRSGGLPPAPAEPGQVPAPRQVQPAVPRALDAVVVRALGEPSAAECDRGLDSATALAGALRGAAVGSTTDRVAAAATRHRQLLPPRVRRRLALGAAVAVVLLAGVLGYAQGRELGTVHRDRTELEALVESTPSPLAGGQTGQRLDLSAPGVVVLPFDPPPGDGPENTGAVPNAVDGDPNTAWETERYQSARFGSLKPGVGLLVDLGQPTAVQQVEVGLRPGGDVELRAADEAGPNADSFPVVAAAQDTGRVARLVPERPVTARWFLVWITRLPRDGEAFQASVGELLFVRA